MEIKIGTTQILKLLYILSWILFVGICIESGAFLVNAAFAMLRNPVDTHKLWQQVDLSALYACDQGYFFVETLLMSIVRY